MAGAEIPTASCNGSSMQLYPDKTNTVSQFLRDKYEREASKYWDKFYMRNTSKFFKDRHYLQQEWGVYLSGLAATAEAAANDNDSDTNNSKRVVLEVDCGVGNAVYPLLADNPGLFVHACDFSPRAIGLVKAHELYDPKRVNAFVCDVTADDLTANVNPASVDTVTLIFVLSAISPEKMSAVVANISRILKPGGVALVRDYAAGDLAEKRFAAKESKISDNFYVRGDGTRAYYFTEKALLSLFVEVGFRCEAMHVHERSLENRARDIVMDRRWIQAAFSFHAPASDSTAASQPLPLSSQSEEFGVAQTAPSACCGGDVGAAAPAEDAGGTMQRSSAGSGNGGALAQAAEAGPAVTGRECIAEDDRDEGEEDGDALPLPQLFDEPPEYIEQDIRIGSYTVKAVSLHPQHRHLTPQTGLLLWESATALGSLLAMHPELVARRSVLELGAGGVGICALTAACAPASRVIATDGDPEAVRMLAANVARNVAALPPTLAAAAESSLAPPARLRWGNVADIAAVRNLLSEDNGAATHRQGPREEGLQGQVSDNVVQSCQGQSQGPPHGQRWSDERGGVAEGDVRDPRAGEAGFDIVLGTDVAYVAEAVPKLFETAYALMGRGGESMLMLCHVTRRVQEDDILREARQAGLVYRGTSILGEPVMATAKKLGLSFDSCGEESEAAESLQKAAGENVPVVQVACAPPAGEGRDCGKDGGAQSEGLGSNHLLRLLCFTKASLPLYE